METWVPRNYFPLLIAASAFLGREVALPSFCHGVVLLSGYIVQAASN